MKSNFAAFATLVMASALASPMSWAGVLTLTPSGQNFQGVALASGATAKIEDRSEQLTSVGHGLRAKKVSLLNVKVYVGQLLVSDPGNFNRTETGALDSVTAMKAAAIRLDFLRTVDGDTVRSSFADALIANGLDENAGPIKTLLDAVSNGGQAAQGSALTFVGEKVSSTEDAVTFESSSGQATTIKGPTGFMKALFSIWLGKAADPGVETLKQQILQGN